ncbi:hypothetical protein LEP1GSC170_1311 [Leptospira interrogans serovar Bataviae str. HAI135]|nr:hypothetical protein LEP1GSC170_1311 [Leptospira interrogans serovar Bataviae str. HAI135]
MLRIWTITILVCFSFGVSGEISSKRKSNLILIKKNLSKTKKVDFDKKKGLITPKENTNRTQETYHKSIVQIKVTYQEPEYHQPWKKKIPGFVEV